MNGLLNMLEVERLWAPDGEGGGTPGDAFGEDLLPAGDEEETPTGEEGAAGDTPQEDTPDEDSSEDSDEANSDEEEPDEEEDEEEGTETVASVRARYDEQVQALQQQLTTISEQLLQAGQPPAQAQEQGKSDEKEQPAKEEQPKQGEATDFLGDMDIEDMLQDKGNFNKVLTNVMSQAAQVAMQGLGNTVSSIVNQRFNMQETVNQFYNENADLVPYRSYVATVVNELHSKNPGASLADLSKQAATEVRSRLKLADPKGKKQKPAKRTGTAPRAGGPGRPSRDTQQAQMDDLLNL